MTLREQTEALEREMLSPFACLSSQSRGRQTPLEPCPTRTCFQRDIDRIIHSKAFRRLKHKTQVFLEPEGDHYRTRMTHTIEVSRIARTIARGLRLNEDLAREQEDVQETEQSADRLAEVLTDLQEELKVTKRQRIRDLMKHPEQEELLSETYDELEADLQKKIEGIRHQIDMLSDKRNTIIQVNRAARTAMEVFEDILRKDALERNDLELIIRKIQVYENHLEIQLQADVDAILRSGTLPVEQQEAVAAMAPAGENTANFKRGMEHISPVTIVQTAKRRPDKVFHANVISDGDPLEIYTDRDGGVIFKKYSLMGGVSEFAGQLCETIGRTAGKIAVITDRDNCVAVTGAPRREIQDKQISPELERLMEGRQIYQHKPGAETIPLCADGTAFHVGTASPILSEGDVLGCVIFAEDGESQSPDEIDYKLAQAAAAFLGKHMES